MNRDRVVDVVVEIPRGSRNKYEYDHEHNVLRLDRLIPLPDKSLLHARNRFGAFGWGLGWLF